MPKNLKTLIPILTLIFIFLVLVPKAYATNVGDWILGFGVSALISPIAGIISLILIPILTLITYLGASIFDWLMTMSAAFAGSAMVDSAWIFLRDFANVSFIFILLIIAISMILRVGKFNDSKLIFRLIVVALLINFSKIIALAVIDFSQVLTSFFMHQAAGGGASITNWSNNIMAQLGAGRIFDAATNLGTGVGNVTGAVGSIVISMIMNIILVAGIAIFFALGGFMMLIRLVALSVLVIVAPFAFVAYIIPDMKKYWTMWWEKLIKYSVFAPIFAFFLYLALSFPNSSMDILTESSGVDFTGVAGVTGISSGIFATGSIFLIYVVTLAFLYFGLYAAQALGMHSGAKAVGWVNKQGQKAQKWANKATIGKVKEKFYQGLAGEKMFGKIPGAGFIAGKALKGVSELQTKAEKIPYYGKVIAHGGAPLKKAAHIPILAKQKLEAENKKILDQYKNWDDDDLIEQINNGTISGRNASAIDAGILSPKGKGDKINREIRENLAITAVKYHVSVNNMLKNDPTLLENDEFQKKLAEQLGKDISELTSKKILAKIKGKESVMLSADAADKMHQEIKELLYGGDWNQNNLAKIYSSDNVKLRNAISRILETIEEDRLPDRTKKWVRGQAQTVIQEGGGESGGAGEESESE